MENLNITKTKYTLEINFDADKGILEMSGSSYPENAYEFFQPIYNWLKTYLSNVNKAIILNIKLDYLNTSSTKCILDVLEIVENYQEKGIETQINWFYEEDDEDMLETGEEFAEDMALPFNFISYNAEE